MIKALTLWQPWASAIGFGLKKYETRSWGTKYRGPLAIHASAKSMNAEYKKLADKYGMLDADLPSGSVIIICNLKNCILMTPEFIAAQSQTELDFGDWRVGRFAWDLEVIHVLPESLACRGYQGLWNLNGFDDFDTERQMKLFD